ncbi:hypothetical protein C7E12_19980, partial [Stenotrophomonas maltophilia]
MDALSRVSAQVLDSALPSLPLYLLQATAVIGMIRPPQSTLSGRARGRGLPCSSLAVGHRREPAMDALSRVSAQVLDSALPSLPLYLLQATAVIGMI